MKRHLPLLLTFLLFCTVAVAEPFYVCVNGTDNYLATATGEADFQGRTQYAATCIALKAGDVITCYDAGSGSNWHIGVIDPYGAYQKFTMTASSLTCNTAGNYDLYIKLKFEDDMWYIGDAAEGCTPAGKDDPSNPVYSSSAPAQCKDVMLQGFYWDSYADHGYGRTKWIDLKTQTTEIGQWFDLVWLPPSAKSTGGTGYVPRQYSSQDSDWGTKKNLFAVIDGLHNNGCRVVADIVVNHYGNSTGWCSFYPLNFGEYGTFQPTSDWIVNIDECFYNNGSECKGGSGGGNDDGYGDTQNYEAGRDLCHSKAEVRDMIKAYLKWMINVIGYDGFRYDYCKGFHTSHINDYNRAAEAYFSVMEYWDGDAGVLDQRLSEAGYNTLTFDFGTKYAAFNNGIAADNYTGCKGSGLLGYGKSRYACTFVDSHDSFQRDDNEFCGYGNSMKYKDKLMQCNAFILSMPGVPCVFYPHWVTFKADLKKLINARYKTGVHSESAVSDEAGNGFYKATITGTNGTLILRLGPNSDYGTTPAGYTLAAKGTNWGVYYKLNSNVADKDKSRTAIRTDLSVRTDVEDVEEAPTSVARKVVENGQIYIYVGNEKYTLTGQPVR